jgi:hypothetical protein
LLATGKTGSRLAVSLLGAKFYDKKFATRTKLFRFSVHALILVIFLCPHPSSTVVWPSSGLHFAIAHITSAKYLFIAFPSLVEIKRKAETSKNPSAVKETFFQFHKFSAQNVATERLHHFIILPDETL